MTDSSTLFNMSSSLESLSSSKIENVAEFTQEIIPKLQSILAKRFPNNPQKQKIKVYPNRLNFAAPCCGDSAKDDSKKRGNIILTGQFAMTYKCHNCGARMSLYSFFKKYGEELSLSEIEYFSSHKVEFDKIDSSSDASTNYIFDSSIDEYSIDKEYFKSRLMLEDCTVPNAGHFYLTNRKQYSFDKFLYQPKYQLLFLLNLTPSNKILGLQIAHLSPKYHGPKYITYKLSKIYSDILKEEKEIPLEIDNLSMIFNIAQVNYNKPVTVVEGPMDSFLLKNCIATCGAGKHVDFSFEYRYLFDDDQAGRKYAIQKLNEGFSVFMWDKLKSDLKMPDRKKWDINDLIIWTSTNGIQMPNLEKYFSNDNLDLLDI